jgi:hypothetical protein
VNATSSRICIIPSQPAFHSGADELGADVALDEVFLIHKIRSQLLAHIQVQGQCPTEHHLAGSTVTYKLLNIVTLLSGEPQD